MLSPSCGWLIIFDGRDILLQGVSNFTTADRDMSIMENSLGTRFGAMQKLKKVCFRKLHKSPYFLSKMLRLFEVVKT
jgi:hypothetical protein